MDKHMTNMLEAFKLLAVASDDPDDTLFLQLTQREVIVLGIGFMIMQSGIEKTPEMGFLSGMIDSLARKISEAMENQKPGHLKGEFDA
jgi:hypothetical protein